MGLTQEQIIQNVGKVEAVPSVWFRIDPPLAVRCLVEKPFLKKGKIYHVVMFSNEQSPVKILLEETEKVGYWLGDDFELAPES